MKWSMFLVVAVFMAGMADAQSSVFKQEPTWTHRVQGKVNVILAQNETFLVGAENGVYLMDYEKMTRWSYPTAAPVTSVKVLDNRVWVATQDGFLRAFYMNGTKIWERTIPGYIGFDDALYVGDRGMLCGSMDGFVYMLDQNGTYVWKHLIGSYVTQVRMLMDRTVAVSDRQVYIMDQDGRVRMNLGIIGYIKVSAISDEMVVVGMNDGTVAAYALSGEELWQHKTGEYISAMDESRNITLGTREMHIENLGTDGKVLWQRNMSAGIAAIGSSRDSILVSTVDNKLYVYTPKGLLRWFINTDGRALAQSVYDMNIVAGTSTGAIYYIKIPRKDTRTSIMISVVVLIVVGSALMMISRSWR